MTNKQLDKTQKKVFKRWLFGAQTAWSYEKMQGLGYCYSMLPVLKEIYKDDPKGLKEAVKNHLQFFNTNQWMASIILGVNVAIEKDLKTKGKDAIASIKTGLMGPLAGVGDTLFYVIIPTILGAIAAYMAKEGSMVGVLIWLIVNALIIGVRYSMFVGGYKQGTSIVNSISGKLKTITDAASILGLTVVGALIPAVVSAKVPYVFKFGEVEMEVQSILDSIMPKLIPVGIVFLVFWLLGKKKFNSTWAVLFLIGLSLLLSALGVLGA